MKKIATLVFILFAAITTYAANTNASTKGNQSGTVISKNDRKGECTVTNTKVARGTDCFGDPVFVSYTCTATASTCAVAYSRAAACAYSGAHQGLASIEEGCW